MAEPEAMLQRASAATVVPQWGSAHRREKRFTRRPNLLSILPCTAPARVAYLLRTIKWSWLSVIRNRLSAAHAWSIVALPPPPMSHAVADRKKIGNVLLVQAEFARWHVYCFSLGY